MEPEFCEFSQVPENHPINLIANTLANEAASITKTMGITDSEFCIALVNACAHIIGECEGLSEEKGLEYVNGLNEIMRTAYIMRNVKGHS